MSDIFFTQADWQLFTNLNTLPQQAGVSRHQLPKLVAKELMDNALDTNAEVEISHQNNGQFEDTIIIKDKGKGIRGSNDEIASLFSMNRPLTSSKRLRLPSRGALGNGLRVVTATVYCTSGTLEVATKGRRLKLIPQDDGSTAWENIGNYEEEGTEIKVIIPDNFFGENILSWANIALKVNQGQPFLQGTYPQWYDSDSFYSLLLTTPSDLLLEEFLRLFDKISKTKAQQIEKDFITQFSEWKDKKINCVEMNRRQAAWILAALHQQVKPINPKRLGEIGALEDFPIYYKQITQFTLKTSKGDFNAEIPALVEVFARSESSPEGNQILVNKTPITGDVDISIYNKRLTIYGCGLSQTLEIPKIPQNAQFWINIITPYMPIVSNGKEPDLSILSTEIGESLQKAAKQLKRQESTTQSSETGEWIAKPAQKQVVLDHLTQAIAKASGEGKYRYSLRQLYYVLRPFVMQATGRELKYANFNNIITDYEFAGGDDLPGVYRDERGTLLHPHTHQEIKLGTKSVEQYQRPIYNFNKILYSEKEGFFEILKDAQFCEKHDCALLTSKGFASRAARDVIDLLAETEEELLFFCIHDADLSGTLIYQALQGATKARPERKVKIINLGLEPWQGLEMGLEVESLERRSTKSAAQYVADFDGDWEKPKPAHFEGYERWAEWGEWLKSFRIELNAMDTPTFITWLDQKVSQYDNGKVLPEEGFLKKQAQNSLESQIKAQIRQEIFKKLNIEEMIQKQFSSFSSRIQAQIKEEDLQEKVQQTLQNIPQQSWQESLENLVKEILKKI
jgi:hypothetical protein